MKGTIKVKLQKKAIAMIGSAQFFNTWSSQYGGRTYIEKTYNVIPIIQ